MCGIFGCIHRANFDFSINNFNKLNQYLSHRGPDSEGVVEVQKDDNSVKLGHKRLSILDLSKNGNQPMYSHTNRFIISFNGEIYNHLELRKQYLSDKNIKWNGTSDTETLLSMFEYFDFEFVLKTIDGMFAFILYDNKNNKIYLARDRTGEKPLYISSNNYHLSFSSDLEPLKKIYGFNKEINLTALKAFLNLNYIPSPLSIFKSVFKLPPGSFLEININKIKYFQHNSFESFSNEEFINFKKWFILEKNSEFDFEHKDDEYLIKKVEGLLNSSVKRQMLSDVPLGAFLSGGIDSSLIVSFMQENQSQTKTFTIGFDDYENIDETKEASKIAKYLSTNHTSYNFTKKEIISMIPNIQSAFSEPFADSSQLPTLLVSKIAKENVKVVLNGDGGDELFGGYNRYLYANKYFKYLTILNPRVKNIILFFANKIPKKVLLQILNLIIFRTKNYRINEMQLFKILNKLYYINDSYSYYRSFTEEWFKQEDLFLFNKNVNEHNEHADKFYFDKDIYKFEEKMMAADILSYLPDDILCKVDRSSMNYSLEARSPFLSKDLINFSFNLPLRLKIHKGKSKIILRKILGKKIPEEIINNSKKGFASPIGQLMKIELKDWTNEILSKDEFSKHNLLNYDLIRTIKKEHFNGYNDHQYKLWSLIQFNQWYSNNF